MVGSCQRLLSMIIQIIQVRRAAKRLMRNLIDRALGHKPLRSRELFQKM